MGKRRILMTDEPDIWSKSKLKSFRQCPFGWKLHYVDHREPSDLVEITDKGIKLHAAFAKFYEYYDDKNKDFSIILDKALEDEQCDKNFKEKYDKHIKSFLHFNSSKLQTYGDDYFKPTNIEVKVQAGNWCGFIDVIHKISDNEIIVVDYKTKRGNDISDYYDELLLYSWMWQKQSGQTVTHIGVFFTENNNFVVFPITQKQIEDNLKELEQERIVYLKSIELKKFPKQKGYYCNFCSYRSLCKGDLT